MEKEKEKRKLQNDWNCWLFESQGGHGQKCLLDPGEDGKAGDMD